MVLPLFKKEKTKNIKTDPKGIHLSHTSKPRLKCKNVTSIQSIWNFLNSSSEVICIIEYCPFPKGR